MPIKKLTLGICLLFAGQALAQTQTHTVRSGETISAIAGRYGVSQKAIIRYNGLGSGHKLSLGQKLTIPNATVHSDRSSQNRVPASGSSFHTVRNGDNDWTIAKRHGITPSALRNANPGVDWTSIQPGDKLRLPGTAVATRSESPAKLVSQKILGKGRYVVREGDNDWIIANRLGTTPSVIRRLNPSIRWNRIQIGQVIVVPGGATQAVAKANPTRLRSRFAVVAKDDVVVRRGPSRDSDSIVNVPQGTHVAVLDRDGDWYRLRFPKGTEGWVRGDMLTAAVAPVAKVETGTKVVKAAPKKVIRLAAAPQKPRSRRSRYVATAAPTVSSGFQLVGDSREKILKTAETFKGVRYVYGAMSRSGTDCSGFTSQVFSRSGMRLPRTSREQARVGAPVKGDLQPGDLVFFKTTRANRISHVGIYVGNGKFIHASSGGGRVRVNSLKEGYYRNRFATARRMVKGTAKKSAPAKVAQMAETREVSRPDGAPVTTPTAGLDQVGN